jgi:hypothetical protein
MDLSCINSFRFQTNGPILAYNVQFIEIKMSWMAGIKPRLNNLEASQCQSSNQRGFQE